MTLKHAPSDRLKRRYLLIRGSIDEFEKALLRYVGIFGSAKIGSVCKPLGKELFIASVNRAYLDEVLATLELYPTVLQVTKISGSLAGLTRRNL